MMGRVAQALMWHEFMERTRDRWVLMVSILFALLSIGVGLYGQGAGAQAAALIGPSLVTLTGLLIPLIALVLGHDAVVGERERNTLGLLLSLPLSKGELVIGKFAGRILALSGAIALGLGAPMLFSGTAAVPLKLLLHAMLLGAAFLSIGILISSMVRGQITAAGLAIGTWFLFVFFYDLGLLGLLVATDGAVSQKLVAWLVQLNPAGLFRIEMMTRFAGEEALAGLGLQTGLPGLITSVLIWSGWIVLPAVLSSIILLKRRVA